MGKLKEYYGYPDITDIQETLNDDEGYIEFLEELDNETASLREDVERADFEGEELR